MENVLAGQQGVSYAKMKAKSRAKEQMTMRIEQLEYILEVAHCQSMSKAAKKTLYQPAGADQFHQLL